jgi:hypothetical protein
MSMKSTRPPTEYRREEKVAQDEASYTPIQVFAVATYFSFLSPREEVL